jgi:hypothetical protein
MYSNNILAELRKNQQLVPTDFIRFMHFLKYTLIKHKEEVMSNKSTKEDNKNYKTKDDYYIRIQISERLNTTLKRLRQRTKSERFYEASKLFDKWQ